MRKEQEVGGEEEKKEEMDVEEDDTTTTTTTISWREKMRNVETAPLFATGGGSPCLHLPPLSLLPIPPHSLIFPPRAAPTLNNTVITHPLCTDAMLTGAMVARVEVGSGGYTSPQGLGQGSGPGQEQRQRLGQERSDEDSNGSEGEEGQWVEKDNSNSPSSFLPTQTSPSAPAIASRIAAFEHKTSLGNKQSFSVPIPSHPLYLQHS